MRHVGWVGTPKGFAVILALAVVAPVTAQAQDGDIRPGDRIVFVQPGPPEPQQSGIQVRRLQRIEDERNLVYEYERPGEPRARQRIVINPRSVVQDIERVRKPRKAKRKDTKTVATTPASVPADQPLAGARTAPTPRPAILPDDSKIESQTVSANDKAPAITPGETRPRDAKNVRVIPLYKPATP